MIILAYLRDGRVHASQEAYEGGDGVADYEIRTDLDGSNEITASIGAHDYVSLWCWRVDSKRQHGAVPLIRIEKRTQ